MFALGHASRATSSRRCASRRQPLPTATGARPHSARDELSLIRPARCRHRRGTAIRAQRCVDCLPGRYGTGRHRRETAIAPAGTERRRTGSETPPRAALRQITSSRRALGIGVLRPIGCCRCLRGAAGTGPHRRARGESFSAITGLRIEGDFAIPKDAQEAEEPVPLEEDDLDADLKPKPEDSLPTPNAMTVAAWWQQTRPKLDARQRYLSGQPHQPKVLLDALISAPMRRRHALALDLELRSRGALRVPTRMFMAQQVEAWKKAQGAPTSTFNRPFAEALRS